MKEDVLEQVVDDYFMFKGYFTRHNMRFKPSSSHGDFIKNADVVPSDIDVVAIHPCYSGIERVVVVSCKSWQRGFDPAAKIDEITNNKFRSGREAWKGFRELCQPKWSESFLDEIEKATGTRQFVYYTAVTLLLKKDSRVKWEENNQFSNAIGGNPIRIITLEEMLNELWDNLKTTPAASEIGRAIQLMKAARWYPPVKN
jgi:hypothetical protein